MLLHFLKLMFKTMNQLKV